MTNIDFILQTKYRLSLGIFLKFMAFLSKASKDKITMKDLML